MLGYVDRIGMKVIVGWVEPGPAGTGARTVKAQFRGRTIGSGIADLPRPDVSLVTRGNPNCGFAIEIEPPYDVDEIEVVADGRRLPRAQLPPEDLARRKPGDRAHAVDEYPLRMTEAQATSYDLDLCKRLISTYRKLLAAEDLIFAGRQSMWSPLIRSNFRNLARIIENGDAQELCIYLLQIHKRPETWGISQGPESYYLLRNALPGSAAHKAHAALFGNELLSLAEYLGIVPVENAEQGQLHDSIDLAEVVTAIREKVGIEPIFPHAAGGLFCLDTRAGLLQQRDVWALYTALRIADLLPDLSSRRICEIGGGLGQLCHYAKLLGAGQYVLIDLPHVSLLQAFILLRTHPGRRIALYEDGAFDAQAEICIYPTFMYERAHDQYFDLTVNIDSMPEMGWDNAVAYARTAARKSAGFLSINQEARGPLGIPGARQINAAEVLNSIASLRQHYRFRSWVRRGYVESYFVVDGAHGREARRPAGETVSPNGTRPQTHVIREQAPYEGYLDTVGPEMIGGWARRTDDAQATEIDILIDGRLFKKTMADGFNPELKKAGIGSGHHAFAIRVPVALFDGRQHQVSACIAGTARHLRQSPKDVRLPDIAGLGPTIAKALAVEPWVIDAVHLNGSTLTLCGWAIPPRDRPEDAGFLINDLPFASVAWPQPRHDIHELYFFHPHASSSGFTLKVDLTDIAANEARELVLRYARRSSGASLNPLHDYYVPLAEAHCIPLPDAARRKRVSGTTDQHLFDLGGYTLLRKIDGLLSSRYGIATDRIDRILDWGCGCGRLLRFLVRRSGKPYGLFGADIDPDNVAWCNQHLKPAQVSVIPLLPATHFKPEQFNLIIGNSVLTHLAEAAQLAWLEELNRLLARDGLALVSVQTITDLSRETFDPATYQRLLRKGFLSEKTDNALAGIVHDDQYYRSAFHTHEYIRATWSKYFIIDDIIPQFSNNMQDLIVMRKAA